MISSGCSLLDDTGKSELCRFSSFDGTESGDDANYDESDGEASDAAEDDGNESDGDEADDGAGDGVESGGDEGDDNAGVSCVESDGDKGHGDQIHGILSDKLSFIFFVVTVSLSNLESISKVYYL